MLDSRSASIEYQSSIKLVELLGKIYDGKILGANTKLAWSEANRIRFYLDSLADKSFLPTDELYSLTHIYECLIQSAGLNEFPAPAFGVPVQAPVITIGIPGPAGADGSSAYLYIGYATDDAGSGFSLVPDSTRKYVALFTSNFPILTISASNFTGLWQKYIGENGTNGTNGTNGVDGIDGKTLLSGSSDPTTEGEDGDFYINTTSWTIFGPKATVWGAGTALIGPTGPAGTNGTNGLDGKTLRNGAGAPSNGLGVDGDFYIDTLNNTLYGPKSGGVWGSSVSLVGPQGPAGLNGNPGADGANGTSNFIWVAYADDLNGNGFTIPFNNTKDYIAFLVNDGTIPGQADFANRWVKYRGDGDRWATYSSTTLTIGTGTKNLFVEEALSYTTGQFVVIAEDGNPDNRMEGYVISYNPFNGQLSVDVTTVAGAGTISTWDVNLQAGVGSPGAGGGSPFENVDVDTGTEVVDTFPSGTMKGVVWHLVIEKGVARRVSIVMATWDGTNVVFTESSALELGATGDVSVSVDIDTGNVRLLATVISDNWIVTGVRYPIIGS